MRRVQFADDEYYHVYNRGVDKRDTFLDRSDYERFLFHLFACNDHQPLLNSRFHYRGLASIVELGKRRTRTIYADILCFCLLPNHFHLLLRQRSRAGISAFLQKVGTAYTMYFNTKYERSGSLFQGPFKAIHVPHERYFLPLTRYIHLNPLDLLEPGWKERGIRNRREAGRYLRAYPWSSYHDYVVLERFPSVLSRELLQGMFRSPGEYASYVEAWSHHQHSVISSLTIEA